jgi:hypothetical protein
MTSESGSNGKSKLRIVASGGKSVTATTRDAALFEEIETVDEDQFPVDRHRDTDEAAAATLNELIDREIEKAKRRTRMN